MNIRRDLMHRIRALTRMPFWALFLGYGLTIACKDSNTITGNRPASPTPPPATASPTPAVTPAHTVTPTLTPTQTPTASPTPRPTASPTPGPPASTNISGTWTGSFATVGNPLECSQSWPAQATFTQSGSRVTGKLDAPETHCGFTNVEFDGTLSGFTLDGVITGDKFQNATAHGTVALHSNVEENWTTIQLTLTDGSGYIPGGTLRFTR